MSTITNSTNPPESRYRQAYFALWCAGALALGVLAGIGYPVVGVGVYVAGVVGAMAVWYRYPRPMFDERDTEIHQVASGYTLAIFGWASAVVFPALTLLYGLGEFTWGPWTTASALLIAALYVTYFVVTGLVGYRR